MGPHPGVLEGGNQVSGKSLAFQKKNSSRDSICDQATWANETTERLCCWLELHPTRQSPWLPQADENL